ncbi:MAG TPA: carboxypeptidase M32 [Thermomicrobiales bacterium]|nr:carboxypeptidase M32 [Thermomicrobiales bacterium]
MTSESVTKLREHLATVSDLGGAASLLGWDQRTKMPTAGAAVRGERLATLGRLAHELFVSDMTAKLLEAAEKELDGLDSDSDEASLVRHTRREFDRSAVISSDLMTESIRASSDGYGRWVEARADSDFASFRPALERILEVNRRFVEAYRTIQPDAAEDYDLLLEEFEPGLTSAEISEAFDVVRKRTIPLVDRVREHADKVDDSLVHRAFPPADQEHLALKVIRQCGFDDKHWRLDETHHPFASSMATTDVRITTRYMPEFFNAAFFGSMHEFGHGLYERQVSPSLERTPLARGTSMAWHESQSRMWENLVGRSRAFWDWAITPVREAFPETLGSASAEDMYRAVNKLHPSLIRVEADELTYNLHIILRFELEREMLAGSVELRHLPEAWNQKMCDYLGVEVPDDAHGVLQDVHWSSGLFGYFPTYALGNILSLQLWQRITADLPDLEERIRVGEFAPLREWLGENIHVHGSKFRPKDLMEKVLGTRKLDPGPLTNYLEAKVDDLYS